MKVRAKKYLGQHFLTDQRIARKIVAILDGASCEAVLEVGPGTGVLTNFLEQAYLDRLYVVELDTASVAYLEQYYPKLKDRIVMADFLKLDLKMMFPNPLAIIGNFPYNHFQSNCF